MIGTSWKTGKFMKRDQQLLIPVGGGGDRSFDLFDTILADCCIGRGGGLGIDFSACLNDFSDPRVTHGRRCFQLLTLLM